MQVVSDLHLHSKYSRAVSPHMTLPVMARLAREKGLDLLSVSDFTHPQWFTEISLLLEEAGEGVYALKSEQGKGDKPVYFLFSTEIACIYKHHGKLRRIHNLIFAPSMQVAEKVTAALLKKGANLSSDGRPIIGLSSRNLLVLLLGVDERCFLIPCHVWTPHFGVYGSASGYDSLVEAFEDLTPFIYGIETGLSSDPDMNWSMKELQNRSILSFSDAHSAPKMGREASVFALEEISYPNLLRAINKQTQNPTNRLLYTIEFYPEEGKYHYSGHRNCKVSLGPEKIRENGNICPVCHRPMTEGVLYRVEQLATDGLSHRLTQKIENGVQWSTDSKNEHPPFVKLVPLMEIIAESLAVTVASKKVQATMTQLLTTCGSELDILLTIPVEEIAKVAGEVITEGIAKVRAGDITIFPGYDGEYGNVSLWPDRKKNSSPQSQLRLDLD